VERGSWSRRSRIRPAQESGCTAGRCIADHWRRLCALHETEVGGACRIHRQPALPRARGGPGSGALCHLFRPAAGAAAARVRSRRRVVAPSPRRMSRARVRGRETRTDEWPRASRKRTSILAGCTLTSTPAGIELEKQHVGRVAVAVQDVGVGLAHGMGEQLVAHEAAIDEEVLGIAAGARVGG
jgi:hypothetical protein